MFDLLALGCAFIPVAKAVESLTQTYPDSEPVPEPWWAFSRADTPERALVMAPHYFSVGGIKPLGRLAHGESDCSAPRNVEMVLVTDPQDPRYGRLVCTWEPPLNCDSGSGSPGCFGVYVKSNSIKWGEKALTGEEASGDRPPSPNKFNGRGYMYRNLYVDGPPGETTCPSGGGDEFLCVEEYLGKYAFTLPKYRFNWTWGGRLKWYMHDETTGTLGDESLWNYFKAPTDIPHFDLSDLGDTSNFWSPRAPAPLSSMEVMECWVMANAHSEGEWPPPDYTAPDMIPNYRSTIRCGQYGYSAGLDEPGGYRSMQGMEGYMSLGHRDTEWSDWSPPFPRPGEEQVASHAYIPKNDYEHITTKKHTPPRRGAWNRFVMDIHVDDTYLFTDDDANLGPDSVLFKEYGDQFGASVYKLMKEIESDTFSEEKLIEMRAQVEDVLASRRVQEGSSHNSSASSYEGPNHLAQKRRLSSEMTKTKSPSFVPESSTEYPSTTEVPFQHLVAEASLHTDPFSGQHVAQAGMFPNINQDVTGDAKGLVNTHDMRGDWPPGYAGGTWVAWPAHDEVTAYHTENKGPFFNPPNIDWTMTAPAGNAFTTHAPFSNTNPLDRGPKYRPSPLPSIDIDMLMDIYDMRKKKKDMIFWYPRPATFYDGAFYGEMCDSPWGLCDLQGDSQRVLVQENITNRNSCDWKQAHVAPTTKLINCAEIP